MDQREEFSARLEQALRECHRLGYNPTRYKTMLKAYGPIASAKKLVTSGELQEGLITLAELGRLDLAIESIMQEARFRSLFAPEELEAAKWRLDRVK